MSSRRGALTQKASTSAVSSNTFHLLRSPSISIISPSHIPPRISLPRISGEYYRFLERPTRRNLWITAAPKVSALHYDADDR